jgi:ERCC4-related helicase
LLEVVKSLIEKKNNSRIICFANYRATVDRIKKMLNENNIKSEILIGQAIKGGFGLSQKKQIETIQNFNDGIFNVLVASSIGEEGLSIKDVDAVIFYDAVASEIRKIQRSGRTGRTAPGKVIFIITKDTVDEAYYYASLKKEAKMKKTLYRMKNRGVVKRKISLLDWIKSS